MLQMGANIYPALCCCFVCLLGFTVYGHITTVPACSSDTLLPHRNAMLPTQDMTFQPRHSIQTQGRPVVVLSIDVERHTGIHNYSI